MMTENKRCGELMIENHWIDKLLKEVLMIDELSIVETDKVNHTVEMDMLKLVVEVECFGKYVDEFDKVIVLFGDMQLKQEDRSYVYASNELHLHVVHVFPSEHEADQHWCSRNLVLLEIAPVASCNVISLSSIVNSKALDKILIAIGCHNQLEWLLQWVLTQYIP
ncbi:hypothetical protein Tco_0513769 [Tanacetum coccineum]